ncbi:MAG: hypothetical protein IJY42_04095 [Clostridia bacterium]|nr:hypothetical protein [Clostridia bacterium]
MRPLNRISAMTAKDVLTENEKHSNPSDWKVELYRSYGVKRRVRPMLDGLFLIFCYCITFLCVGVLILVGLLGFGTALAYTSNLAYLAAVTGVVIACLYRPTRTVWKRLRFCRKLKALCQRKQYHLVPINGFFYCLFDRKPDAPHFFVDTGNRLYAVQYLTFSQYRTHLTFSKPGEMVRSTWIGHSRWHIALGIKPRHKTIPYEFSAISLPDGSAAERIFLLNPVPCAMFIKTANGEVQAADTGAVLLDGIRVFSGSGFLRILDCEQSNDKK